MFEILPSTIKIKGFSNLHFCSFRSLMKYGEIIPWSNLKPFVTSTRFSKVFPSLTVITPSFPTLAMAEAINAPISASLLAEMVATSRKY
jgi:hypothetical protein